MKFLVTTRSNIGPVGEDDTVCLVWNNWDDFGFKTTFEVYFYPASNEGRSLGSVRVMMAGQESGPTELPEEFERLDDQFCSLGSSGDYYRSLLALSPQVRAALLGGLNDCVADQTRFNRFRHEPAMQKSLLRDVSPSDVMSSFPRILAGDAALTAYEFKFFITEPADGHPLEGDSPTLAFNVRPHSKPPTNVHVLIGKNGVGKTRILAGMADSLTANRATTIGMPGRFEFGDLAVPQPSDFLNLVIVSFSAFDRFDPIPEDSARTDDSIPYSYVGIKKRLPASDESSIAQVGMKTTEDLNNDFNYALSAISEDENRLQRWVESVRTLESDPGIAELRAGDVLGDPSSQELRRVIEAVAKMSSGHKIVLLTLSRLIENVSDRSLVLIDEPETHLHPPLLNSFMRSLSALLTSRNAVAIVATHSPVVLQEVPAKCVWMLRRMGQSIAAFRPDTETFAENVSVLTRRVFGLEVEQSGFYRLLETHATDESFDDVMETFNGQVGAEGRALLRAFTAGPSES